jgi:3-hydroxymyristoyl/3-hydroxydecanoyl-(acyl carrier protein) dehydratase
VVQTDLARQPRHGIQSEEPDLPPLAVEAYSNSQIDALRQGDLAGCFGPRFANLRLREPLGLPAGRMKLVDRVHQVDPKGGQFGIGLIRASADIHPDDWFLTCHFVDDRVMPGTLMYECCLHTLRIYLLRIGWIGEAAEVICEPVPGVASRLKCRGQVTQATRTVTYEVTIKERGYRPEPYALADALLYADGKPIVEITNLSLRLTGLSRERIAALWATRSPALFDRDRILAFAIGKPSEAFGEPYRVFDEDRFIARLPGPPYSFLDRITHIEAEPWKMVAGGVAEAQYDVPRDAWYFDAERQPVMPFAILLEVALQSCGWLAAYLGSALTSPVDLCFRNLDGRAELLAPVRPDAGTLTTRVRLARVANSAGMILQTFDFEVRDVRQAVYKGSTSFGFFSRPALAQQVGIRDALLYEPGPDEIARGRSFPYPRTAPFPDDRLRMIDRIDCWVPGGGPQGRGLIQGSMEVDPAAWFFKAHFLHDPVWPGSLGLESLLQLLKADAMERWSGGPQTRFAMTPGRPHAWRYRGQVVPSNRQVIVQAVVTGCTEGSDGSRQLTADGCLLVDGLLIYQMKDFGLNVVSSY